MSVSVHTSALFPDKGGGILRGVCRTVQYTHCLILPSHAVASFRLCLPPKTATTRKEDVSLPDVA